MRSSDPRAWLWLLLVLLGMAAWAAFVTCRVLAYVDRAATLSP